MDPHRPPSTATHSAPTANKSLPAPSDWREVATKIEDLLAQMRRVHENDNGHPNSATPRSANAMSTRNDAPSTGQIISSSNAPRPSGPQRTETTKPHDKKPYDRGQVPTTVNANEFIPRPVVSFVGIFGELRPAIPGPQRIMPCHRLVVYPLWLPVEKLKLDFMFRFGHVQHIAQVDMVVTVIFANPVAAVAAYYLNEQSLCGQVLTALALPDPSSPLPSKAEKKNILARLYPS